MQGQVQGVGFRPFVYQLARRLGLRGEVSNRTDGVHIVVNASQDELRLFVRDLQHEHPPVARITHHTVEPIAGQAFKDFTIVPSSATERTDVLLTPDLGLCPSCRAELNHPADRRHGYAFTTCTHCGPRYSVIRRLPYDRETTTMEPFPLCDTCQREYHDPTDRRYYAQTNTCPTCAIPLQLYDLQNQLLTDDSDQAMQQVAELLTDGAIVAVKGIGGYLLLGDAAQPEVVRTLRQRKQRPSKPLAVMYPSLAMLAEDGPLSATVRAELTGAVSPIVLLPLTSAMRRRMAHDLIAPQLDCLGVMLPYAPLYEVLMQLVNRPLVATSGNVSGAPIVYQDDHDSLNGLADYRLTHPRAIVVPQDDSVVQYSPQAQQRIVLRRSRGLAPTYVPTRPFPDACVLATGGQLKGTFTYTHRGNAYVSQYLGDLDDYDAQQNYRRVLRHTLRLFGGHPAAVVCDRHPQYFTTALAEELARAYSARLVSVPHHQAHFAAVLGEHHLTETKEPILGVVWDGTGLGDDGQVWGGEFFTYQDYTFGRAAHFSYFRHLLGDKMAREPRLSALSLAPGSEATERLRLRFSAPEWSYYLHQREQADGLSTSSVGRLFDAVAGWLGVDRVRYEGEAALYLETLATRYVQQYGYDSLRSYLPQEVQSQISTQQIVAGVVADLTKETPERIAACFHYTLAQVVRRVAQQHDVRRVAFSGGVFQNALLVDMIHQQLSADYRLYFHQQLSPNDENISFGQLTHYHIQQQQNVTPSPLRVAEVFQPV
jgi:hydrogenase maturation protein HypF